jgi:hypothetical protein
VSLDEPSERFLLTLDDVELTDGVIELDLAVTAARAFHGVVWRLQDDENYESFFVRPHQVGNPDSIQYTPVNNGIASWQLYHGPGFWATTAFPIDGWFRSRIAFTGERAEVDVGATTEPTLAIAKLKRPAAAGRVGVLVGGPGLHLAHFAYDRDAPVAFRGPAGQPPARLTGIVPAWSVSDAFAEDALDRSAPLERAMLDEHTWTELASEPSGPADLSRVNGIRDGRNTAFARAVIRSERAQRLPLDLGFSDRAVVFLNGHALYRATTSTARATIASSAASAGTTRSIFRSRQVRTTSSSPSPRTSEAGASRPGSATSPVPRSPRVRRRSDGLGKSAACSPRADRDAGGAAGRRYSSAGR